MVNFTISDGENYWSKYEDFVELYNARTLNYFGIREKLEISSNKYREYRKRAIDENRLNVRSASYDSWKYTKK